MAVDDWLRAAAQVLDEVERLRTQPGGQTAAALKLAEVRAALAALTEVGVLKETDALDLRLRVTTLSDTGEQPEARAMIQSVYSVGTATAVRAGQPTEPSAPRPPDLPERVVVVDAHFVVAERRVIITTIELWSRTARLRLLVGKSDEDRRARDELHRWWQEQREREQRGLERETRPPADLMPGKATQYRFEVADEAGAVYAVRAAGAMGDGEWDRAEYVVTPRPPAGATLTISLEDQAPVRVPIPG